MSHYGFSFGTSSIRMSVFFLRLGEFSAVTLCQRNNLPLSLCFSFWEPYNVNVSLCDVSRKYLELSSLFLQSFFFSIFYSIGLSSIALSSSLLILSSTSSNPMLNPSRVFFSVQLLHSSALWLIFGTFFYFLFLYWHSHCVHLFFSGIQWTSLWLLLGFFIK